VVVNVADGTSVRFQFKSSINGYTAWKDSADFSKDACFASLMSKPFDYWLRGEISSKLPAFD